MNGGYVAGCDLQQSETCCAQYCDLDDPEACPDPEESCLPFFDAEGFSIEGFESLGMCLTGEPPAPETVEP